MTARRQVSGQPAARTRGHPKRSRQLATAVTPPAALRSEAAGPRHDLLADHQRRRIAAADLDGPKAAVSRASNDTSDATRRAPGGEPRSHEPLTG
jgi:hypothetical protein